MLHIIGHIFQAFSRKISETNFGLLLHILPALNKYMNYASTDTSWNAYASDYLSKVIR